MSIIATIDDEYLFKMKLFYRKKIPSNDTFYVVFFLIKFLPIMLFTHGIDANNEPKVFTITKIIRSIIIFNHKVSVNYISLCCIVYAIIIILLLSFLYIFLAFLKASKTTDNKLYGIPSNKFEVSTLVKVMFRYTCYLFLFIMFIYQHLIEILFYGIFKVYSSYIDSSNFNNKALLLEYKYPYLILGLNIFFIIVLFVLLYNFFALTTTQTISNTFGFNYSFSRVDVSFYILMFSLQGVYSTSYYYTESYRKTYQIILCYIMIGMLGIKTFITFYQVNYLGCGILLRFISFLTHFCLISGVTEVMIYHIIGDSYKGDQVYYFVTLAFDLANALLTSIFIEKIQKTFSFRNLASNVFFSNKFFDIDSLFGFYWKLKKMGKGQNRFLVILELFQVHQEKCSDEKCRCQRFMKYLSLMHNKERIDNLINKFFYIGESKITEMIMNRSTPLSKLLFLHCDFLYSLKENLNVSLYLCQYYLIKMRNDLDFHYAYMIYELNYLTMKKIKLKDKSDKKAKGFLKENLLLDKIMKIISILCTNIERLLYMKNLKNSNSKLLYTCEDILNPLTEYVEKNTTLIGFIISFTKKHRFELSIEVKFLLYYYSKLFNTMLPKKTKQIIYNASNPIPSYDEFEKINFDKAITKKNALILFLTHDNKFIIRYTSTEINDILLYKRHELLGTDFNEIMIPKDIAPYHTIYMKEFILMGNKGYAKSSFLLNKDNQLIPVNIMCEVQPTISSLYTFIVNVELNNSQSYKNYYVISDTTYNLWSISESFEKEFFFSVKMLNSLKINICDMFGVNKERLNEYFKNIKFDNTKFNKKQINALTSVKKEEMYFYDTMDVNWLKTDKQKAIDFKSVKLIIVGKDKFIAYLRKLFKNIEELGIEIEWKIKLANLFTKLKYSALTQSILESNNGLVTDVGPTNKESSDIFLVKYHLKLIGQLQYYVMTISEIIDENLEHLIDIEDRSPIPQLPEITVSLAKDKTIATGYQFKDTPSFLSRNNSIRIMNISADFNGMDILKKLPSNISKDQVYEQPSITGSFANMNSGIISFNNGSLTNSTSLNNVSASNALLLSQKKTEKKDKLKPTLEPVLIPSQIAKETIVINKAKMDKLIKDSTILQVYKFVEFFLLFGVLMLNIGNFIYNQTSLTFSLNLFNINSYSFLLGNDIFYGSMASLNLCLLTDEIQRGDIENLQNKIQQSAKDLMNHYQLLYGYMNLMIEETPIIRIYSLFNIEKNYSQILSNWVENEYISSLIGEIYSFHYWLKTFNAENSSNNYCRIQRFFFSNKFNEIKGQTNELATNEEKFIYYICSNVVSHISEQLEDLTKISNDILKQENKNAKVGSLAINICILIVGAILYGAIVCNLQASRVLFKGKMIYLFTKHENEEVFNEDIGKFKKLLDCFSKMECNGYTVFKTKITDTNNLEGGFYMNKTVNENSVRIKKKKKTKYKSSKEKEKEREEELRAAEELENKNDITNMQFDTLATPRFSKISLLVLSFAFMVFFTIEILGVVLSTKRYDGLMTENEFATNFLNRGPKLNELVLYSIISVILNDPNYISRDPTKYKESVLSNYFNIDLDLESNSIFQALGESDYAYLYYQIYIIRNNILMFINKKEMSQYLPTTSQNEYLFDNGENFCVYATYQYVDHYYGNDPDNQNFLELITREAKQCRTVGNGMNLNGYNAGMDLMLLLLQNLYYTFKNEEDNPEERQKTFLMSDDIKIIEENLLNVIRSLHFADSFLVIEDINNSYHSIHRIKIIFSLLSIGLTGIVILSILVLVVIKLEYYNYVLTEIVTMFDRALKNYNALYEHSFLTKSF